MKEWLQVPKLNQYAQHKNEHNVAVLDPIVCKAYKIPKMSKAIREFMSTTKKEGDELAVGAAYLPYHRIG